MLIGVTKSDMLYALNSIISVNQDSVNQVNRDYVLWRRRPFYMRWFFYRKWSSVRKLFLMVQYNQRKIKLMHDVASEYSGSDSIFLTEDEYYSLFIGIKQVIKNNSKQKEEHIE